MTNIGLEERRTDFFCAKEGKTVPCYGRPPGLPLDESTRPRRARIDVSAPVISRRMRLVVAPAILLLLILVLLLVLVRQITHVPSALAYRRRASLTTTRHLWSASLAQEIGAASTYAAVAVPGAQRWVELLISAGVPVPLTMAPEGARWTESSFRLLVVPGSAPSEAMAALGKAVVVVVEEGEWLKGQAIRWRSMNLPLAGQPCHVLVPDRDEQPWLLSELGETIATRRRTGDGIVLRIGLDLAAWMYRLRQGDPALAQQNNGGNRDVRPVSLLPPPPPEARERPFADEMVDDLLSMLDAGLSCPLPRTAGLPDGRPTVVLISDQDFADDAYVLHMAGVLEEYHATATFMLTHRTAGASPDLNVGEDKPATLARESVMDLLAQGHGLGVHPFLGKLDDIGKIVAAMSDLTNTRPLVARNHRLRWSGFLDIPAAEAHAGILMDLNYTPVSKGEKSYMGFVGGSARPLCFVSEAGVTLPILQQPVSVDDYSMRQGTPALAAAEAAVLGNRTLELLMPATSVQAPLVMNAHPILFPVAADWFKPLIDAGVQVISAEDWLSFVARRRLSRISSPSCLRSPSVRLEPGVVIHAAPDPSPYLGALEGSLE